MRVLGTLEITLLDTGSRRNVFGEPYVATDDGSVANVDAP